MASKEWREVEIEMVVSGMLKMRAIAVYGQKNAWWAARKTIPTEFKKDSLLQSDFVEAVVIEIPFDGLEAALSSSIENIITRF